MNKFAYVTGDPINSVDFLGLTELCWTDENGHRVCEEVVDRQEVTVIDVDPASRHTNVDVHTNGMGQTCFSDSPCGGGYSFSSAIRRIRIVFQNAKKPNQCAAQLSQNLTLNYDSGNFWTSALLGNTVGTVVQALLGPESASAGAQLAVDPLTTALVSHAIVNFRPGGITTNVGVPISHMPNTYNPVTAVSKPTTVGMTSGGSAFNAALSLYTGAKLVFDTGVYIGALTICSQDPQ